MTTVIEETQKAKKNVNGKKAKRVPVSEQYSNLQTACRKVVEHLERKGIVLPEASIKTIGVAVQGYMQKNPQVVTTGENRSLP